LKSFSFLIAFLSIGCWNLQIGRVHLPPKSAQ
jgi:hypothetical protein